MSTEQGGGGGESKSEKEFENLLKQVGGWGAYQYRLLLLFFVFSMVNTYVAYTPVLFLHVPDHWCRSAPDDPVVPLLLSNANANVSDPHFVLPDLSEKMAQCYQRDPAEVSKLAAMLGDADVNGAQLLEEVAEMRLEVPCRHGWEYNTTEFFTSAATDMNWVCEDAWKGPLSQSIFYAGGVVGTLAFGIVADYYGRFPAFFYSSALIFLAGVATPFCTDFVSFSVMRFFMGLTYDSAFSVFYLLAIEYVSVEKRSFIGNFGMAIGFTIGGVYQPWLLKWLGDWKIFHHLLFVQSAVIFITPWIVHESVVWLASQGEADRCKEILVDIADTNGKKLAPNFFDRFEKIIAENASGEGRKEEASMANLFKTPGMRRISVLMILTWVLISSLYDAHILNMANLNHSIYLTFTVSSLLEFPGDLLSIWGTDALGRRWSCCISLVLSGICMLVSGIFHHTTTLLTTFAMLGRFFITYALNAGMQFQFEVFPTQLRAQGSALASVCVMVFQFFIPYIVYSSHYYEFLPFIILAALSFLGGFLSLLLPETAEVELPDTVHEAEELHRKTRFFHLPVVAVNVEKWLAAAEVEASSAAEQGKAESDKYAESTKI